MSCTAVLDIGGRALEPPTGSSDPVGGQLRVPLKVIRSDADGQGMHEAPTPLVSVVMPVWNAAPYVEEAVRSILDQTTRDLELIVVDDSSTDGSSAVVAAIGDPRIRTFSLPHGGDGPARNLGIDVARGRFVVWQDADDVALPQRLERMLSAMVEGVDFVHHDMVFTDPDGVEFGYQRSSNISREHVLPYVLREGCPYNCGTVMWRRESIGGARHTAQRINNDVDFMRQLAPRRNGVHLPEPLYLYRKHPRSSLATHDLAEEWPALERLLAQEPLELVVPDAYAGPWQGLEAQAVARAYVASVLWRRSLPSQAMAYADAATSAPLSPAAAVVVSGLLHLAMGELAQAHAKLVSLPPSSLTDVLLGDVLGKAGDVATATRHYRRALELNPRSYDALSGLRAVTEAGQTWVLDNPVRRLLGRDDAPVKVPTRLSPASHP